MNISDLFSKKEWRDNTPKIVLINDTLKSFVAVAMHETPWYLRMIGFPRWRVKEKYSVGLPIWSHAIGTKWKWGYYTDIHDYARKYGK